MSLLFEPPVMTPTCTKAQEKSVVRSRLRMNEVHRARRCNSQMSLRPLLYAFRQRCETLSQMSGSVDVVAPRWLGRVGGKQSNCQFRRVTSKPEVILSQKAR